MTNAKLFPIPLDPERKAAYTAAAEKAGMTLAAWICEQCDKGLPKRAAAKLSARKVRGRPRKESDDG